MLSGRPSTEVAVEGSASPLMTRGRNCHRPNASRFASSVTSCPGAALEEVPDAGGEHGLAAAWIP